jgi:hypothetical protein
MPRVRGTENESCLGLLFALFTIWILDGLHLPEPASVGKNDHWNFTSTFGSRALILACVSGE